MSLKTLAPFFNCENAPFEQGPYPMVFGGSYGKPEASSGGARPAEQAGAENLLPGSVFGCADWPPASPALRGACFVWGSYRDGIPSQLAQHRPAVPPSRFRWASPTAQKIQAQASRHTLSSVERSAREQPPATPLLGWPRAVAVALYSSPRRNTSDPLSGSISARSPDHATPHRLSTVLPRSSSGPSDANPPYASVPATIACPWNRIIGATITIQRAIRPM